MKKSLGILAALGIAFFSFASTAHADETADKNNNKFSLHLEPGVVFPLTSPQSDLYNPGLALGAKGMFALTPNLSIGPSVSAMYLPRQEDNGQNAGTLWQFGGSARLQTDRRATNKHPLFSSLSPWVDVDAAMAATGNLLRPAFDVGAGFEQPMDNRHAFWLGPFVRYTHMFQTSDSQSGIQLNKNDVNFLQVGLSFSFDTPTRDTRTVTQTVEHRVEVVKHDAPPAPCPPPPPVAKVEEKVEFSEVVYFDFDSSKLRWESVDRLNRVVARLSSHPDVHLRVEGHASSDGQKLHNIKLSGERVAAVVQYLTQHGVSPARLSGVAMGIESPAAPNDQKEGRERNRRVEFRVDFISTRPAVDPVRPPTSK